MKWDLGEPLDLLQLKYQKPPSWEPEEDEPAIWLQEKEPLLKRFWDYINPMDLFQFTKQTYETTPEMQGASNLEVLDNMSMSLLNAAGGGDTNRFLKWEQEARNRGISPLMYAEPIAAMLTLGLMAHWGISAALSAIQGNPTLTKMAVKLISQIPSPGTLEGAQYVYSGFPIDKALNTAIQASSGLANVGQLQKVLSNILPGIPAVINNLIDKAVAGTVTNQDIISLVGKEKALEVSTIFGKETGILEVFDEAGKLKRVEAEKEKLELPKRDIDIELFRARTKPQGDELYSQWQTLIKEGEKETAENFVKELEVRKEQDPARYALIRIKKKGHAAPRESLFVGKEVKPSEKELTQKKKEAEVVGMSLEEYLEVEEREKALGIAPEIAPKVEVVPTPFDEVAKREGPLMVDAIKRFESAKVYPVQSNLGGTGTYPSLQSTDYDRINTYMHFNLYDKNTIDKLKKAGFDLVEGPQYIELGREEIEDVRQLRVSFNVPLELSSKQVDEYNTKKLDEMLSILKAGKVVDESVAPKVPLYEDITKGIMSPEMFLKEIQPVEKRAPIRPSLRNVAILAKNSDNFSKFNEDLLEYIMREEEFQMGVLGAPYDEVSLGFPEVEEGPTDIHYEQLVNRISKQFGSLQNFYDNAKLAMPEIVPRVTDGTIPEDVSKELSFNKSSDIVKPTTNWLDWEVAVPMLPEPPTVGILPTPEEMAMLPEPKWEDFGITIGAQIDSYEHFAMRYEEKTGVPMYSGVAKPIIEAGKIKTKDNRYFGSYISQMFKGIGKDDMIDLTDYMKELQVRGVAEELPSELMAKNDEIRAMFDYGFVRFGVDPHDYIENYLPMLSKAEKIRLDSIPVSWKGIPEEVIPFFQHIRYRLGEIIDAFTVEDLLRLYFNAGTWAEYRNAIAATKDATKNFPKKALKEVIKLDEFLTGGTSDFDEAVQNTIRDIVKKASKGRIDEESDVMTALVNAVYLGTIAFNPGSAIKNLTQSFHNWSELPAQWMAIGNKFYFSKEGQDVLKQSGIMMGYAPYAQRAVERFFGEQSKLDKAVRFQSNLRNVGMYLFQTVDSYNRGTIYLAEWSRMNHFLDLYKKEDITLDGLYSKIDLAGLHPTAQKMLRGMIAQKEWESAADFAADQRQAMTQWRYQREVRPQWMRPSAGKVAGQFLTWPTYGVVFHAGRYKRASEAFGRGETKEGLYQLWKEIKWLAAVATTVYVGKKAGVRLWPWFMFLPTQGLAALQPLLSLSSAAINKAKGYDWIAGNKWRDFKYSAKIFAPGGVEIGKIYKAFQRKQPAIAFLPMYPKDAARKEQYGIDEVRKWLNTSPTVEDWLKGE